MGMNDLISRQAAIEEILGCCPSDPFGSEYECGYDDGLRQGVHRLKHLPTIDAVPVVRCKECKYWKLSQYNTMGIHICWRFSGVRGEHDFCSRGERKDDET